MRTPRATRQARDEVRLAAGEMSPAGYAGWMAEEQAHFAADRPWERADAVVDGSGNAGPGRVRAELRPSG